MNNSQTYSGQSTFSIKKLITDNIGILILAVLFVLMIILGKVYQPWGGEDLESSFCDVIRMADKKGVHNITPFLYIMFKGILDSVNCMDGSMGLVEGDSFIYLMFLSAGYFILMSLLGTGMRTVIFSKGNNFGERIKEGITSWLFDNIWMSAIAYLWWFIVKFAADHPKGSAVVLGIITLLCIAYVIAGILAFLAYALILYASCIIMINVTALIPETMLPVRIAVMIILGLAMRMLIDLIIDKVTGNIDKNDILDT